jgi:GT2 family glycosyltransferase
MIRVAVSILNHSSAQSTTACVQSLLGSNPTKSLECQLQVFVADNASGEDEQRQLQQSLEGMPNVQLRCNSENMGFAAGHNRNLEVILAGMSPPDYIWLLNNDCLVDEDTLPSLINCAIQHPDVGIWGATLLEPDGETIQCAGGCFYNAWVSSYRQYGQGKSLAQIDQLESVDFDYIAGASLFFPVTTLQKGLRSVPLLPTEENVDKQQWLNERFFLYFEELDLAQRLKPGLRMAWCKGALIRHTGGVSTGTANSQRTELAEYHSTLSALKFTRQYYPLRMWIMVPARFLSKCLQLVLKGEFQLIVPLMSACRDFWRG